MLRFGAAKPTQIQAEKEAVGNFFKQTLQPAIVEQQGHEAIETNFRRILEQSYVNVGGYTPFALLLSNLADWRQLPEASPALQTATSKTQTFFEEHIETFLPHNYFHPVYFLAKADLGLSPAREATVIERAWREGRESSSLQDVQLIALKALKRFGKNQPEAADSLRRKLQEEIDTYYLERFTEGDLADVSMAMQSAVKYNPSPKMVEVMITLLNDQDRLQAGRHFAPYLARDIILGLRHIASQDLGSASQTARDALDGIQGNPLFTNVLAQAEGMSAEKHFKGVFEV